MGEKRFLPSATCIAASCNLLAISCTPLTVSLSLLWYPPSSPLTCTAYNCLDGRASERHRPIRLLRLESIKYTTETKVRNLGYLYRPAPFKPQIGRGRVQQIGHKLPVWLTSDYPYSCPLLQEEPRLARARRGNDDLHAMRYVVVRGHPWVSYRDMDLGV